MSDTLEMDKRLFEEGKLVSRNGKYYAIMQPDSNFVLYRNEPRSALWASGISGTTFRNHIMLQKDGNLVKYDFYRRPQWSSRTDNKGRSPHRLVMQDDGNLVVYDADNKATWSTDTYER